MAPAMYMSYITSFFTTFSAVMAGGDLVGTEMSAPVAAIYAAAIDDASREHGIDPSWVVAVITYESKWRPTAVLPGCGRRRARWCNRDGHRDAGLMQVRVGPAWTDTTMVAAMNPIRNIQIGVAELATHRAAHRRRGCRRWAARWPHADPDRHDWIQHNNMGSRGYGARVAALRRRILRHPYVRAASRGASVDRWSRT